MIGKFMYKTLSEEYPLCDSELNDYGSRGWELISVQLVKIGYSDRWIYHFKRKI